MAWRRGDEVALAPADFSGAIATINADDLIEDDAAPPLPLSVHWRAAQIFALADARRVVQYSFVAPGGLSAARIITLPPVSQPIPAPDIESLARLFGHKGDDLLHLAQSVMMIDDLWMQAERCRVADAIARMKG